MRNVAPLLCVVVGALLACKMPGKAEKESPAAAAPAATPATTPATPAATPVAPATPSAAAVPSAAPPASDAPAGEYSTEGLRQIPDNCVAPQVILTAVPKQHFESEGFLWRFATQVAVANPQFNYQIELRPGARNITFTAAEHTPTKGVALVARCNDPKTCTQFAAAYRTVVPTSKPEVLCGKATTLGADLGGPIVLGFGEPDVLKASLPTKDNVIGKCVRLAACQAARDKKLDGDPAIDCQKKPSTFKLDCAAKYPCSAVLSCVSP